MKKTLLSAVSVAALLGFGSAAYAMNNTQATEQDGSGNVSTVQQAGADNVAGEQGRPNIQDGDDNTFYIDQVGDLNGLWSEAQKGNPMADGAQLNAFITDGTLDTLNGNGDPNTAINPGLSGAFGGVLEDISRARQVGDRNSAFVNSGNERDDRSGMNFFNVRQTGDDNTVQGTGGAENFINAFSQSGMFNVLLSDQQGSDNTVRGDQVGNANTFAAVQSGAANLLDGDQQGSNHKIVSYQAGGGNTAHVTQNGGGNIHTNIQGVTVTANGGSGS